MKTKSLLIIGVAAVVGVYLYRENKKKTAKKTTSAKVVLTKADAIDAVKNFMFYDSEKTISAISKSKSLTSSDIESIISIAKNCSLSSNERQHAICDICGC